jgi:pimeloyl-ACP methyl ester carboxylesterase
MRKVSGLLLILCALVLSALPVSAGAIPAGFKGNLIEIKGQQLRVYQTGSGPDILLIHGLPGCIEDWETIIPELSKKYRVTAYDRPGHGFSSANSLRYDVGQNADIALALIDKLKLNNPVVVGHSYGGTMVVAIAERNPSNVKAIVSVSPVTTSRGKPDTIFYILRTPLIGPASAWLVKLFTGCSMIRDGLNEAFDPNQKDMQQGFIDVRCMIFSQSKVLKTLSHEEMTMRADVKKMAPLYGIIKKPLFIVHGESDRVVPVADGILLSKAAPGSRLILYKNTGHMVQYAKPAELIQVIEEAAH